MAVAYINSRAIQNRLDETVGAFNWRNTFSPWQNNAQICGISIYDEGRGDWVTKQDGAENTDIEPIKGGLSDSFKRSACVWGIGRYLYELDGIWVEVEQRGKSSYIKDNQRARLEAEYNRAVSQIFSVASNQARTPAPVQQQPAQQQPQPTQQTSKNQQPAVVTAASDYWVQSVKPSGKESQLLELVNEGGEVVSAYVRKSDKAITTGSRLQNVNMVRKQSSYGQYNLIDGYRVAA